MNHTPGPWGGGLQISSKSAIIAHLQTKTKKLKGYSNTNGANPLEALANSKLISAAPELLEALTNLMDQLESVGIAIENNDEGQWHGAEGLSFNRARKAIAKATGEQP